ncbi:EamA/RhaT family transporter [Paenibacillus sp. PL2-23]|uniref:EamA/RhaT family transporter n=1 Tax=Paenibacillus sp. PL2-23 TaxID=2100729 RepID=UPI0030F5169C
MLLANNPHAGKLLMLGSALLTATGQLFWKWGHDHLLYMIPGFLCYGTGAILMIRAFAIEKLSVCYPLMCTSYIFALAYGSLFLGETFTIQKAAAVVLLGIGVTLTSYDK